MSSSDNAVHKTVNEIYTVWRTVDQVTLNVEPASNDPWSYTFCRGALAEWQDCMPHTVMYSLTITETVSTITSSC